MADVAYGVLGEPRKHGALAEGETDMGSTVAMRVQARGHQYVVPRVRDYGTVVEMTATLGLYGQYSSFLTGEPPPPSSTPETPCKARDGC